jgi:hypothetical protein
MKDQQMACVLLILVIGGFGYGAQTFQQKMAFHQREAEGARAATETAMQALAAARRDLDKLTRSTTDLRGFLEQWDPYLRATQSPQATEQRIVDLVKQSDIFTESQRFELLDRSDGPVFKSALRAHIVVKDEYSKAINWLAVLEETLPTSRICSCVLRRSESANDIRMELIIDLPITTTI